MKQEILRILKEKGQSFSTIESCTGGGLAKDFVLLPGASDVFRGSLVSYQTEVKKEVLGVSEKTLNDYSAVSKECAEEMAQRGRTFFSSDYTLITTGYAGPSGGKLADPVGTVYFAVCGQNLLSVERRTFTESNDRSFVIESAIQYAWEFFHKALCNK